MLSGIKIVAKDDVERDLRKEAKKAKKEAKKAKKEAKRRRKDERRDRDARAAASSSAWRSSELVTSTWLSPGTSTCGRARRAPRAPWSRRGGALLRCAHVRAPNKALRGRAYGGERRALLP